jgi:hypothetical protein
MTDERDQLGHDDSQARKDLRAKLVEAYRSLGLSFPETDEEIAAFVKEHGPFEPMEDADVERLGDAVLERLDEDEGEASPDFRLWADKVLPSAQPAGVYRSGEGGETTEQEAVLGEHRRQLREEILRRRAARGGGTTK